MRRKLQKFENVDLVKCLRKIIQQNTHSYQSDFELDKKILFRSADCSCVDDRRFLWLSYPCGTRCLREYDVFINESIANATWKFYGEQLPDDPILAYFVETKKVQDEMLIGDVYELDYSTHFKHVKECSVSAEKYQLLVYEHGERMQLVEDSIDYEDEKLGIFQYSQSKVVPDDEDLLRKTLKAEALIRKESYVLGNFAEYLSAMSLKS